MALMLGALPIHGIVPGPQVIARQPDLFLGLIASFWIGNVLLAILNLPLIGLWIRILQIPYRILYSSMLFFICVVVYSISNNVFDIFLILFFGVIGCGMMVLGFPAAPLLLGVLLSPSLELWSLRATMRRRAGAADRFRSQLPRMSMP